jgi:hypothetical protein
MRGQTAADRASAPDGYRLADLAQREAVVLSGERSLRPLDRLVEWLSAQLKRLVMHGNE